MVITSMPMNVQQSTATVNNAKTFRAVGVVNPFIYPTEHESGHFRSKNSKPKGLHPLSALYAGFYPSFTGGYISVFGTLYRREVGTLKYDENTVSLAFERRKKNEMKQC